MEEFLLFLEGQQGWFYGLLVLAGILYLRLVYRSYRDLNAAIFRLERERARARLFRSLAMLLLVFAAAASVFILTTFTIPAISMQERATPLPTVSLLATPETGTMPADGVSATEASFPSELDASGCTNQNATVTSPEDGDSVSGVVTITGTANIPNFAFYKIEFRSVTPDSNWMAVLAGTETVCEDGCQVMDELGSWDTSLVTPGDYALRLVVTDTAGNAPLPCTIRLNVLPPP
jgi:hypothetical protein